MAFDRKEYLKQYRKDHPEKVAEIQARYWAKKTNKARILTFSELIDTPGCGFIESVWFSPGQTIDNAERDLEEAAWITGGDFTCEGGVGAFYEDQYGVYHIPTDVEFAECDDPVQINTGYRVWNIKPTMEEMKKAQWTEVEKHE